MMGSSADPGSGKYIGFSSRVLWQGDRLALTRKKMRYSDLENKCLRIFTNMRAAMGLCHVRNTRSDLTTEVKQHWARKVLGWEAAWELLVLLVPPAACTFSLPMPVSRELGKLRTRGIKELICRKKPNSANTQIITLYGRKGVKSAL